jgi:hypothetical protein
VEDSFLGFRELIQAEETSSLVSTFSFHLCQAALDSSGIVLEANRKARAGKGSLPDTPQQVTALAQIGPCFLLFRQEDEAECGENV